MSKIKRTCNFCFLQMNKIYYDGKIASEAGYCKNPACPSYALVQIPLENMPKEKKVKK